MRACMRLRWQRCLGLSSSQLAELSYFRELLYISKFICLPTDAQLNCLENNIKITSKLTLKQLQHVSV